MLTRTLAFRTVYSTKNNSTDSKESKASFTLVPHVKKVGYYSSYSNRESLLGFGLLEKHLIFFCSRIYPLLLIFKNQSTNGTSVSP